MDFKQYGSYTTDMTNSDSESTRLNIRKDRPTAISSRIYGTVVDALAFNIDFIALKNPKLAVELLRLYEEAHKIKNTDPKAHDEDLELFTEALKDLLAEPDNS